MKRQLLLPGLPPTNGRRARADKRAKRDWNEAEFARALHRNGVMPECDSLHYVDVDGPTGERVFHAVMLRDPIRVARRATLAKILKARGGQAGTNSVAESNRAPPKSRIAKTGAG